MPDLIALRAMFGQDEANHGTARYRVGIDGTVNVPSDVAVHLVNNGGFSVLNRTAEAAVEPRASDVRCGPLVRVRHNTAVACSYDGNEYRATAAGDFLVPAAAVMELMAHGFTPARHQESRDEQTLRKEQLKPARGVPEPPPSDRS